MAIQPIDLSVIYSQMDNVAKFNASQNHSVQFANQYGRDKTAAENLEKSKIVQNAAQNDVESNKIKNNLEQGGSSNQNLNSGSGKKKKEEDLLKTDNEEFSDPGLGKIIDITG
ncbi:MAG: hypothetical protein K6G00_12630 [Treponema sp.]|nr:hypothetical protein [Treponema sp.]